MDVVHRLGTSPSTMVSVHLCWKLLNLKRRKQTRQHHQNKHDNSNTDQVDCEGIKFDENKLLMCRWGTSFSAMVSVHLCWSLRNPDPIPVQQHSTAEDSEPGCGSHHAQRYAQGSSQAKFPRASLLCIKSVYHEVLCTCSAALCCSTI